VQKIARIFLAAISEKNSESWWSHIHKGKEKDGRKGGGSGSSNNINTVLNSSGFIFWEG
jgi:hypothetical protein